MALGIPNEVFWQSAPNELGALFKAFKERNKQAYMRAGLVAATIINVNRRKGSALVQPGDFFREPPSPEDFMSVEEATAKMDAWALSTQKEPAAAPALPDLELRDK